MVGESNLKTALIELYLTLEECKKSGRPFIGIGWQDPMGGGKIETMMTEPEDFLRDIADEIGFDLNNISDDRRAENAAMRFVSKFGLRK